MKVLWAVHEDDILHGLRERGLPVSSTEDLTGGERELIRRYVDLVFTEATREMLDMLAENIRRSRGISS